MLDSFFPTYFEWWHVPAIFLAGLVGEGYGGIVGGGSVVMQGTLILLGVPLKSAIAIDNAAALGTEAGVLTETRQHIAKHKKLVLRLMVPVTFGGLAGTWLLLAISPEVIKYLMVAAIVGLLLHLYYFRGRAKPKVVGRYKYALLFAFMFLIGIYNNFIGVGEGTFAKMALISVLGITFLESHGLKTLAMVPIRLVSLVVTAAVGLIVWPYLLTLWCSTFLAGKYATRFVKKVPESYFKPMLATVSVGFVMYLLAFQ